MRGKRVDIHSSRCIIVYSGVTYRFYQIECFKGNVMANSIKYWRKKRKISQAELAKRIGMFRPLLSNLENPNIPIDPDEEMALKIARVLGVMVTDILRKASVEELEKKINISK
jgi:transcriptional regulator with XRE-family HTH domain